MKTRTGYLKRGESGWRVRFRVQGRDKWFPLVATDEDGARAEAGKIAERLSAKDSVVLADSIRSFADRLEQSRGASTVGVAGMWADYLSSRKRPNSSPSTLATYADQVATFVAWAGDIRMEDVTPSLAERYADKLDQDGLKGGTVNKHLAVLRLVWKILLPRRENPWAGLKSHVPDVVTKHLPFTADQLRVILNRVEDGEFRALLWILAYTGLRLGDACCLQVGHVHLSRRVIELYPAKTGARGSSPLKAKIGIHVALLPVLYGRVTGRLSGAVLPEMAALYRRDRSAPAKLVARHLESCGLENRTVETGHGRASCLYGAHSFRHTLQTLLNEAEIHPMVSDVILCHKTGSMAQHYSHVSDAKVVEAIDRAVPDFRAEGSVIKLEAVS